MFYRARESSTKTAFAAVYGMCGLGIIIWFATRDFPLPYPLSRYYFPATLETSANLMAWYLLRKRNANGATSARTICTFIIARILFILLVRGYEFRADVGILATLAIFYIITDMNFLAKADRLPDADEDRTHEKPERL